MYRKKACTPYCFDIENERENFITNKSLIPGFKKLYDQYESEGIKPIDPERMGLLMIPPIQQILEQHPEWKP